MNISEMYDINRILLDIEMALCIDGKDYGEKDILTIFKNVRTRIIRQYQLDLTDKKIDDSSLYIGKTRSAAVLFIENISVLHSRLCGFLHIVRFHKQISISPANINYMGFTPNSFNSLLIAATESRMMPNLEVSMKAIANKFATVNTCIEKKLILIMLLSYEFGLYEMVAAIAEVLYLGGKV